ncbi:MAG TPA: RHS repeat-associated core domain-containing protein [Thermoanaerobaculia bacterium]|jgi:RHS repeat-associated protein
MKRLAIAVLILFTTATAFAQAVTPNVERGFASEKAYSFDGVDSVNLFNGNLGVTVPIGQRFNVGGNLSYQLTLNYGGNNWEFGSVDERPDPNNPGIVITYNWAYPSRRDNAGFGWQLHMGRLLTGAISGCGNQDPFGAPGYRAPAYLGPDGAAHCFYTTLHDDDHEAATANVAYTRDGTYLRLRKLQDGKMQVDFPDGTTHEFDLSSGHASNGGVTRIFDAFNNQVTVDYNYPAASTPSRPRVTTWRTWRISDSAGRAQYVFFRPGSDTVEDNPGQIVDKWVVAEVWLSAFGGNPDAALASSALRSIYSLRYDNEPTFFLPGAPPPWTTLARACTTSTYPEVATTVKAAVLQSVTLPDGSAYRFVFHRDTSTCDDSSGVLKELQLPTLGKITWDYGRYSFPPSSAGTLTKFGQAFTDPFGVIYRKLWDATGVQIGERFYDRSNDILSPDGTSPAPPRESRTVMTDFEVAPNGTRTILEKSQHFFSISGDSTGVRAEYGLPLSRKNAPDSGSRYLSQILYGPDSSGNWTVPLRTTRVAYAGDRNLEVNTFNGRTELNRRLRSTRTTDEQGYYLEETFSDDDGLGHYRTAVTTSNYGNEVHSRETRIAYNRRDLSIDPQAYDSGSYDPLAPNPSAAFLMRPPADPWILSSYSSRTVLEGASALRSHFVFDRSNGALLRSRTLAGATPASNDLVTDLTRDVNGNVAGERYYGGDTQSIATGTLATSTLTASAPTYALTHEWLAGSVTRSGYVTATDTPLSFRTYDVDIDAATGRARRSRDTAGLPADFSYDTAGRLVSIAASGIALTTYAYTNASLSSGIHTPAQVTARQVSAEAAGTLATDYAYDAFGRLLREKRRMPDETDPSTGNPVQAWSLRQYRHNSIGWQTAASEWERFTSDTQPAAYLTTSTYDALRRVQTITAPDGKTTVLTYPNAFTTTRTVRVATTASGEEDATTIEEMDGFGRLRRVTEPSGTNSANVPTVYTYDAAGLRRVRTEAGVVQERTFVYDGRGFLTSEVHPEKDAPMLYSDFDARGHATRAVDGPYELRFTFDRAERPTLVTANGTELKRFVYATANDPVGCTTGTCDARNGKLFSATRYNDQARLQGRITVEERYQYHDRGGRISSRQTIVAGGRLHRFDTIYSQSTNDLGLLDVLKYPGRCLDAECTSRDASRQLAHRYGNGYLRQLDDLGTFSSWDYLSGMTYHPSGVIKEVRTPAVQELWKLDPVSGRPCSILILQWGVDATEVPGDPCDHTLTEGNGLELGPYRYDGSSNIRAIGGTSYRYDKVNRLVETNTGTSSERFTYDPFGNRTSRSVGVSASNIAVDSAKNRLTAGVTYDTGGSMSSSVAPDGSTYRYTWDGAGMMSRLSIDSTAPPRPNCPACNGPTLDVGYLYTADNERIATVRYITGADFFLTPWTSIAWSVRHPSGLLLAQWKDEPTEEGYLSTRDREYVWRGSTLLATLEPWIGAPLTLYHHADHLGSRRVISDTFSIVDTQDYAPFGAGGLEGAGPLQFTGHERDTDIGPEYLDYMHARFYNPNWGRFLSVDPSNKSMRVELPQTLNRYSYVMNNPMNYTDPTGQIFKCVTVTNDDGTVEKICSEEIEVSAKADRLDYLGDIFFDFLVEGGSDRRLYNGDDFQTRDIARSPGASQMRDDFVQGGCQDSSLTPFYPGSYDHAVAYRETIANGSFVNNPIAAQVGGFSYRFDRLGDGRVMYTVANQLSAWSLLYHINGVPHKERGGAVPFMGNVDERFRWTEDLPPGCR